MEESDTEELLQKVVAVDSASKQRKQKMLQRFGGKRRTLAVNCDSAWAAAGTNRRILHRARSRSSDANSRGANSAVGYARGPAAYASASDSEI